MKKLILLLALITIVCSCGQNSSKNNTSKPQKTWQIGDIVDDFDEPTGKHFVVRDFYGTFSNSATTGSKLRIRFWVKNISRIEYNPTIILDFDEYCDGVIEEKECVYIKIVNKERREIYEGKHHYERLEDLNGDYWMIDDILEREGIYHFTMESEYGTKYQFTLDTNGLTKAMVDADLKRPIE